MASLMGSSYGDGSGSSDDPSCDGSPRTSSPAERSPDADSRVEETVSVLTDNSEGVQAAASDSATGKARADGEEPEIMDSRAYQLEMLDKSLKQNVIVAVGDSSFSKFYLLTLGRWTLAAERHRCEPSSMFVMVL